MDRVPQRPKRVFVSVPRDHNLREPQRLLKRAVLAHLRANGLEPQEFQVSGLPVRAPYTIDALRDIMSRCHGVLVVLEEGAKLPADVGGGIYLSLKDRTDISPIHSGLLSFIRGRI
jgi:hypothetical protein